MIEIIPTVVPQDISDVEAAQKRYASFAKAIHIDACNETLAPNDTWLPKEGDRLPKCGSTTYEAHLMIAEPLEIGHAYIRAGASRLIAHVESFSSIDQARGTIDAWRSGGAKEVGLAALLETPLEALEPLAQLCDVVLLMTIAHIGKQGSPFDRRGIERIVALRHTFPKLCIAADGGISESVIDVLVRSGASRLCVGSAIVTAQDPAQVFRSLNERATIQ